MLASVRAASSERAPGPGELFGSKMRGSARRTWRYPHGDRVAPEQTFVIIGAGLAGGNAAVTLREQGFEGRIVLIGRDPDVPFGRPPLSKTYLRSEDDLSGWYVKPAAWYD